MDFAQALDWLYATQFHGIKLGLGKVERLLDFLQVDPARPRFLHVAGTNGKGSVCAMLDSMCRAANLRTGLFTSPHLIQFNERIRLNGAPMPENEIATRLTTIRDEAASWPDHPTFFEITTALALAHFQRAKTEVVILETGLGGRLDATNVVTPIVSVLTSIDFDHEAWLGHSLAQIAAEKAGIIKAGVPVVSALQHEDCAAIIRQTASTLAAPCEFVAEPWERSLVNLIGRHQRTNAALAVAALRASGLEISSSAIAEGLATVAWPGRFQQIRERLIIDGAHNPAAAQRLVETWRESFGDERATIIFAAMGDKDVRQILTALQPIADSFVLSPLQNPRAAKVEQIAAQLRSVNPAVQLTVSESLNDALQRAEDDLHRVLITGSLFLAGEALAILQGTPAPRISTQ